MQPLKPRTPHGEQPHTSPSFPSAPPSDLPESRQGLDRESTRARERDPWRCHSKAAAPSASRAPAAALANARWSPTKEQVAVLEGLYEHGLHTPNAEQIKQITARLRVHGHIEGKNVFYWFQNHKARQRQKQKQDSFAYFTRLLRHQPPLPVLVRPPGAPYPHGRPAVPAPAMAMAPPDAAACNSNSIGAGNHVMYTAPFYFHPQQQMPVLYPRMDVSQDKMIPAAAQQHHHHAAGTMYHAAAAPNNPSSAPPRVLLYPTTAAEAAGPSRETLQLFPLQPTFLLPGKDRARADAAGGASMASTLSASESPGCPNPNGEAAMLPFYDFFGLQSGGR